MKKPLLTIIIPAYNCESTISNTLQSLNLKSNVDVCVAIINDGSTDKTKDACLKWVKSFPSQVFLYNKKNGNWGSVMNFAFKNLKSKYFKTLDSDDTFNKDGFKCFLDILKNSDPDTDLFLTNHVFVYNKTGVIEKRDVVYSKISIKYNDSCKFEVKKLPTIHNITFSERLVRKIKPLPENVFYSDSVLIYQLINLAGKVGLVNRDIRLYEYYVGVEGQSININSTIKNIDDLILIFEVLTKFKIYSKLSKSRRWAIKQIIKMVYFWILLSLSMDQNKTIIQKIEKLNQVNLFVYRLKDEKLYYSTLKMTNILILNKFSIDITIKLIYILFGKVKSGYVKTVKVDGHNVDNIKKYRKSLKKK